MIWILKTPRLTWYLENVLTSSFKNTHSEPSPMRRLGQGQIQFNVTYIIQVLSRYNFVWKHILMKRWSCSYFLIVVHLPQYGRRLWRWVTRTLLALCFATITCPAPSPVEGNIGMNIFKYYLTIFSLFLFVVMIPVVRVGVVWSQLHVTMLSSQCCLYWLLTTGYTLDWI